MRGLLLLLLVGCDGDADDDFTPDAAPPACVPVTDNSLDCRTGPRGSPFTCVRYTEACGVEAQVEAGGEFRELRAIDGRSTASYLGAARQGCAGGGDAWKARFAEDLPQVFAAACLELGATVTVTLGGDELTDVAVTEAKRAAVQACWKDEDRCEP